MDLKDNKENHDFIFGIPKSKIGTLDHINFATLLFENFLAGRNALKDSDYFHYELDQSRLDQLKSKLVRPFRKFVERDGVVNYHKHPELAPKFQQKNSLELKIRESIQFTLRSDEFEKRLQYNTFDVINDRYVIPIRSDSYNASLGIIVSRSASGSTLFVEPTNIRELCNQRIKVISEIEEIIERICREYGEILLNYYDLIRFSYDEILYFDYLLMISKYSSANNYIKPEISGDNEIYIKNFTHPLIKDCVANTVEFHSFHKGMIISGPNTGGKTVAIKSIVICHLFLKLGILLPATSAKLRLVNDIFYFDSDYQNISDGLSSFAGEVTAMLEMLQNIKDNSLVAADEIFNSTASDEASSLAISIIEHLTETKDAFVLISTHHQLLKTHMQENKNFISAHVGYDFDNNRPTYKIVSGTPGTSMALTIFEKLSQNYFLDVRILDRAKSILDSKFITYETLLQDLSQKKSNLDKTLMENRQINKDLKNQKKSMEGILFLEKNRLYEEYKHKLEKIVKKVESIRDNEEYSAKQRLKMIKEENHSINPHNPNQQSSERNEKLITPPTYDIGTTYFCSNLQSNCVLSEINRNKATIQVKGKSIIVPLSSLYKELKQFSSKNNNKPKHKVTVNVFRESSSNISLDVRGIRLEEFQSKVFNSLQALLSGDIPFVNIIHGHGNGVLKNWLRDHLRSHPEFNWAPEDGNDGCTRVELAKN